MKQFSFSLILALLVLSSAGQEKKDLVLSVSGGVMSSPFYNGSKSGPFYAFDFDYHLSKRSMLSVNYFEGTHHYFDNILSNDPMGTVKSDGTNAIADYHIFSVLYKYHFINSKLVSANIGLGAGIMTLSREYPYTTSTGSSYRESTYSDLVFPVRMEVDYKISTNIRLGLIGGFHITPDYPILAYYFGPRLGYKL
jgi:hypothetical protein